MRLLSLFWRSILLWTAIISLLLFGITVVTGSEVPVASAPVWIGLAFMLAAYPSGIRVAPEAIPGPGLSFSRLGLFVAASASASVAAFVLVNWLAPLLLSAGPGVPVGADMTLGEIRDELRVLGEVARGGPPTAENWLPFNQLAFQFVRRTDGMLLPALFAWVGLLTGYWTIRVERPELRRLAGWGLGAFLMVATYFAGENGYEMILQHIGRPAEFVGDLVLIVPGTLIIGLGLATMANVLSGAEEDREAVD